MSDQNYKVSLLRKFARREARIAVVGLGYVGLPLVIEIAKAGYETVGIDISHERVDTINEARSHIEGISSPDLAELVHRGRLTASADPRAAADCDAAIIVVPTPVDRHRVPNLGPVRGAVTSLAKVMKPGSVVVLESTTYPGTTEELVVPAFLEAKFVPGKNIFIGYSPERIDPGNSKWGLANTPKIVAGLTPDCLAVVEGLYATFVQKLVPVSNLRTAETTKLFENIFRIVNIALVNEFQMICDAFGMDVWEIIEACSTKPYGFTPFYPGPGLGGHCVPVDPFYLSWKARERQVDAEFIELAGRVNAGMQQYILKKVAQTLNVNGRPVNSSRVALIGMAYKKNVSDIRESPAVRLVDLLVESGASVSYHDPYVPRLTIGSVDLVSQPLTSRYLASQDCVVVLTDHDIIDWRLVLRCAPALVDTRNVTGRIEGRAARSRGAPRQERVLHKVPPVGPVVELMALDELQKGAVPERRRA